MKYLRNIREISEKYLRNISENSTVTIVITHLMEYCALVRLMHRAGLEIEKIV